MLNKQQIRVHIFRLGHAEKRSKNGSTGKGVPFAIPTRLVIKNRRQRDQTTQDRRTTKPIPVAGSQNRCPGATDTSGAVIRTSTVLDHLHWPWRNRYENGTSLQEAVETIGNWYGSWRKPISSFATTDLSWVTFGWSSSLSPCFLY